MLEITNVSNAYHYFRRKYKLLYWIHGWELFWIAKTQKDLQRN